MKRPDDQPLPADRAQFNSKTFTKREMQNMMTALGEYKLVIRLANYWMADQFLELYMDPPKVGDELNLSYAAMKLITSLAVVAKSRDCALNCIKNAALDAAKKLPSTAASIELEITSGWDTGVVPNVTILTTPIKDHPESHVRWALGHFSIAVGADISVKRKENSDVFDMTIYYNIYFYDFYNYAPNTSYQALRDLELAGKARSYHIYGSSANVTSEFKRWDGTLSEPAPRMNTCNRESGNDGNTNQPYRRCINFVGTL
ncbi:hypothetical protein ACFV24_02615 [Nocardia fluminea]|uniref:hypothetical protein n=1 Tax=Nocardia fluminea TaxID=134984 RepID=UPI00366E1506